MSKFKVGDTVTIVSEKKLLKFSKDPGVSAKMLAMADKKYTIKSINKYGMIYLNDCIWTWIEKMFEPKEIIRINIHR